MSELEPQGHERTATIVERDVSLSIERVRLRTHAWDGGSRRRVLLLHGLGGNSITWHGVAPILAARLEARVIAPDLPGFGASRPGPERLSIKRLVEIVRRIVLGHVRERELVGALEPAPTPWIIAGNSLGGLLALELARQLPSEVGAITLAASALPLLWGRTPRDLRALLQFLPGVVPQLGRRLIQRYVMRTGLPGVVDDPVRALFANPLALRAELRERLLTVSAYRMSWATEAARAYEEVMTSLTAELTWPGGAARAIREVRCPVQVIYGTLDPLYPEAAWRHLHALRPDWDYVPLRDIGHVPQLEAPDAFAEHMLAWLERAAGNVTPRAERTSPRP
jgi:pimeloyl-ACP methyl ester carboxylesterase